MLSTVTSHDTVTSCVKETRLCLLCGWRWTQRHSTSVPVQAPERQECCRHYRQQAQLSCWGRLAAVSTHPATHQSVIITQMNKHEVWL